MTDRILNNPAIINLYKQGRTAEATLRTVGTYLFGLALGALILLGLLVAVALMCWPLIWYGLQMVCWIIWH